MEYHRAQVRKFLGFRECTAADAEKLATWLAGKVCQGERRPERAREELLKRCRQEGIEQPAPGRTNRIIGSGLREAEKALVAKVTGRIPAQVGARMNALIAGGGNDDAEDEPGEDGRALFAQIRDDPGNVSLATVREEVAKLAAIRAIGLPSGVFVGIAPKVVASWRDCGQRQGAQDNLLPGRWFETMTRPASGTHSTGVRWRNGRGAYVAPADAGRPQAGAAGFAAAARA